MNLIATNVSIAFECLPLTNTQTDHWPSLWSILQWRIWRVRQELIKRKKEFAIIEQAYLCPVTCFRRGEPFGSAQVSVKEAIVERHKGYVLLC